MLANVSTMRWDRLCAAYAGLSQTSMSVLRAFNRRGEAGTTAGRDLTARRARAFMPGFGAHRPQGRCPTRPLNPTRPLKRCEPRSFSSYAAQHTASFILPLKADPGDGRACAIMLDAGRNIGNAALGGGSRRLDLMSESVAYRAARKMSRGDPRSACAPLPKSR
jgi:hypothetical protein